MLRELHQPLDAARTDAPHAAPHLEFFAVTPDESLNPQPTLEQCRQVEAHHIAGLIEHMVKTPLHVWDKATRSHRAIQPGDIAVLSRTWDPLDLYGQAIEHRGIPIVQAGGGSLLDTREAKDAIALLQFLADPRDDLALVAVLRSPFFAISDRTLATLSQGSDAPTWWQRLNTSDDPAIGPIVPILSRLLRERTAEPPTRLLQLADRWTGYTAVIANLPGGDRRMADWQGLIEVIRPLELGIANVMVVVRRLQRLMARSVSLPRPALAAGNAVSLMTIHAAKGLEWPVVIVPDLTRKPGSSSPTVRLDPSLGVALMWTGETGEAQKSALYSLLDHQQAQRDQAEAKRLLYVAFTRARDRLIVTAPKPSGSGLTLLEPGFDEHCAVQPIPFKPERLMPLEPVVPPVRPIAGGVLIAPVHADDLDLPVTALTTYARCPHQFQRNYIDGHPGFTLGISQQAAAIGSLTHRALAQNLSSLEELQPYTTGLTPEQVQEALHLAEQFRRSPMYATVRQGSWETALHLNLGSLRLNGAADLVGDDFVLDIKTDREMHPDDHRFQLWAYATATQKSTAHIAYLRHNRLYTFSASALQSITHEAHQIAEAIAQGHYTPTPSPQVCTYCPYQEICDAASR